jgi:hypothetical protein
MLRSTDREQHVGHCSSPNSGAFRWLAIVTALTLAACASRPPAPAEPAPAAPPPSTEVYFYPTKGQSAAQQDRDRYECYLWAKKQTGFDPSAPGLAPHQRVRVIPTAPPSRDTAAGAVTGAVIGAVVSPPGRSVEGAAVGAVAGAVLGAASDASRQEQVERVQQHHDRLEARRMARLEQQAMSYRRAMAACLEGRGYSVH